MRCVYAFLKSLMQSLQIEIKQGIKPSFVFLDLDGAPLFVVDRPETDVKSRRGGGDSPG